MSPLEQSYQAPSLSYMKGYVEDIQGEDRGPIEQWLKDFGC